MGGSDPQPPQFIQPPPPTITQAPPPNVAESSAQLAQSQLQYNPQLVAQQVQLQGQFAPQLAQQQFELQQKFGPLYYSLYKQLFPTQVQGQETLAQQALQKLISPQSLTPEQAAAQQAIRDREQERFLTGIRTQANLGGTLFGGRREEQERLGLSELANQYALQDIALQQQQRQQALQELIAASQVIFPQVQQPNVPSFGQGVTPSPDALLSAIMQGQIVQPAAFQPGIAGTPGQGGQIAGQVGGTLLSKFLFKCLPGTTLIDTPNGGVPIQNLAAGDEIVGGRVMFKSQYAPQETCFVKLMFADGSFVETCDTHLINGHPAISYKEGDRVGGKIVQQQTIRIETEMTYDMLTDQPDGGYQVAGIPVTSMIPSMHRLAKRLQEVA